MERLFGGYAGYGFNYPILDGYNNMKNKLKTIAVFVLDMVASGIQFCILVVWVIWRKLKQAIK